MQLITIDNIRQHLRLNDNSETDLLNLYGNAAEETLFNYIGMGYDQIMQKYGHVPAPLMHAALMLVDTSYQYRSPVSPTNISIVPYTFDILVKPYIKLSD